MTWKRVVCCPHCKGELLISFHFSFTKDFKITRDGVMSKRFKRSTDGSLECSTGYCSDCGAVFDEDQICVEEDGAVYVKVKEDA